MPKVSHSSTLGQERRSMRSLPFSFRLPVILMEWQKLNAISDAAKGGLTLKASENVKAYDEVFLDHFRKTYCHGIENFSNCCTDIPTSVQ
jgi:hypothetical protein